MIPPHTIRYKDGRTYRVAYSYVDDRKTAWERFTEANKRDVEQIRKDLARLHDEREMPKRA